MPQGTPCDPHTVKATPERTGKRKVADEEPVTARIRRRAAAELTTGVAGAVMEGDKKVAGRGV
jgi:hypothetical protein